MRVSLMNLGDGPRVFHNRLNRAVVIPVGRVVTIDMNAREIQDLQFPRRPESVLIGEPDVTEIPESMQKVVHLLSIIEFEENIKIIRLFHEISPPSNLTHLRPSRMQIRGILQTMVEDFVTAELAKQRGEPKTTVVRDDEDPELLERELARQREPDADPPHPIAQLKQGKIAAQVPPVLTMDRQPRRRAGGKRKRS
jgi:hypothetical protein